MRTTRLICISCALLVLICAFTLSQVVAGTNEANEISKAGGSRGAGEQTSMPANGDWVISQDTIYIHNSETTINGNLTIKNGGALVLDNSTLRMNSTQSRTSYLNATSGELYANFSKITSLNSQHLFRLYTLSGKIAIKNSVIEKFEMGDALWYSYFFADDSMINGALDFVYGDTVMHKIKNCTVIYARTEQTGVFFENTTFTGTGFRFYAYNGASYLYNSSFPDGYFCTYQGTIEAINVTYKYQPQTIKDARDTSTNGKITVKNHLSGILLDQAGNPAPGTSLLIKDATGRQVSGNIVSLQDGTIPQQTLTVFEQTLNETKYYTPHVIYVGAAKPQVNISKSIYNLMINKDAATDLAILSAPTFSDNAPVPTERLTINATITNIGDVAASDVKVDFFIDSEYVNSSAISSIGGGASIVTSIIWQASEGEHRILARINGTNEWLLDNNEYETSVIVSSANVFKGRKVVVLESGIWGLSNGTDAATSLSSTLREHQDIFGAFPVMSAYVFTGSIPDFPRISGGNFSTYYSAPMDSGFVAKLNELSAQGLVYVGYNGRTPFNSDVWLLALREGDSTALAAFDRRIVDASSNYNISSEYTNFTLVGFAPKSGMEQNASVQSGVAEFYRLFGFYPSCTSPANYSWSNITEEAWRSGGLMYISVRNKTGGGKSEYDQVYLRQIVIYDPFGGHDFNGNIINQVDSNLNSLAPLIIYMPANTYLDGSNTQVAGNREKLSALLSYIESKTDPIYMTSDELGQLYSTGRSIRRFSNASSLTAVVRNYLPADYPFSIALDTSKNYSIEAVNLRGRTSLAYSWNSGRIEFLLAEGDYRITVNDVVATSEVVTLVLKTSKRAAFVGDTVVFDASSTYSSNPNVQFTYRWDFDDGETFEGSIATHRYQVPGTYRVQLTADDGLGGVNTQAVNITIGTNTTGAFSLENTLGSVPYAGPIIIKYGAFILAALIALIVIAATYGVREKKKARRRNIWLEGGGIAKDDIGSVTFVCAKCPKCFKDFDVLASKLPGDVFCPSCGTSSFVKNPAIKEMKIKVACTVCGRTNAIGVSKRPTTVVCPSCGTPGFIR